MRGLAAERGVAGASDVGSFFANLVLTRPLTPALFRREREKGAGF